MPKFLCRCEHVVNLSPVPCPEEKFLIDGADFYAVIEAIASQPYKQAIDMLEEKTRSVLVCAECGRHYVSKGHDSEEYWAYVREQ
jgi:rubrerythrin